VRCGAPAQQQQDLICTGGVQRGGGLSVSSSWGGTSQATMARWRMPPDISHADTFRRRWASLNAHALNRARALLVFNAPSPADGFH
jgi:hypothetical protein